MKPRFWGWLDGGLPPWYAKNVRASESRIVSVQFDLLWRIGGNICVQSLAWRGGG